MIEWGQEQSDCLVTTIYPGANDEPVRKADQMELNAVMKGLFIAPRCRIVARCRVTMSEIQVRVGAPLLRLGITVGIRKALHAGAVKMTICFPGSWRWNCILRSPCSHSEVKYTSSHVSHYTVQLPTVLFSSLCDKLHPWLVRS